MSRSLLTGRSSAWCRLPCEAAKTERASGRTPTAAAPITRVHPDGAIAPDGVRCYTIGRSARTRVSSRRSPTSESNKE